MINGSFIKEQFKNIQKKYQLDITLDDEYQIEYQNKNIRIYFGIERWDTNGIITSLTNKLKDEFYYPWDIEKNKGFDNYDSHLNEEEKNILKKLKDGNDKIIFAFRVLLEKNCQDVLNGDFSAIGEGKSH